MPNYRFSDAKRTPSDSHAGFPADLDIAKAGDRELITDLLGTGAQPSTGLSGQWVADADYSVEKVGVAAATPGNGVGNIVGDVEINGTSVFAATADRPSQTSNTASARQKAETIPTGTKVVAKGDFVQLHLDDNGAAGTRNVTVYALLRRQV